MEFGFHPDPAIDFVCEVDAIEAEIADRAAGYTEGSDLCARIERAMQFKVGGDPRAVVAKADLRRMEAAFKAGAATTKQEEGETLPGILCPNGGYCDYPSNPCFTCRRPRPSNPSGDGSQPE